MLGIANRQGSEILGVDLDQRDVGALVTADNLGLELAPVGQRDEDIGCIGHHVVVGQDRTIGGDDESRTHATRHGALLGIATAALAAPRTWRLFAGTWRHGVRAEEVTEHFVGVLPATATARRDCRGRADVDHRRLCLLDDRREVGQRDDWRLCLGLRLGMHLQRVQPAGNHRRA